MSSLFTLRSVDVGADQSNRWFLSIQKGHSPTDEAILDFIKSHPFLPKRESPVIQVCGGSCDRKRRVFRGERGGVYFVESYRDMQNPRQFQGADKTGRVVTTCLAPGSRPPGAPPLLFLKNQNILLDSRGRRWRALATKDRIGRILHGIQVAQVLGERNSGVQRCLDQFQWTSRGGNAKVAYICEMGQEDLAHLKPLPLPMKRSFQLQMATTLMKIYEQGYHNRDIKLANMIVSWDRQHVLLIDLDMCFPKEESIEPKRIGGTPRYLSPEYAILCSLREVLLQAPSERLIPHLTSEKGAVFALGLSFMEMSGLRSWRESQTERLGANFSASDCIEDRASFTPSSFREFLISVDPSNQAFVEKLRQYPLLPIEESPPDATSWERLFHQMVAPDPRERPSFAEVSERILAIMAEESETEAALALNSK